MSSRLRGYRLRVRLHADIVELEWRGQRVAVMRRLVGRETRRINYRHPTKPGRVTVAGKPSDDLASGTLNSILKQSGLKK